MEREDLAGRCGTCARFVRVVEKVDDNGEVKRTGDCLLGVWPAPLEETDTCDRYVRRGTVPLRPATTKPATTKPAGTPRRPRSAPAGAPEPRPPIELPEDLLAMDADEFRNVLREVLREELGVSDVTLGARWRGGELVIKPGNDTQEKRIPLEQFFHKIVMIRDKLRLLEARVNAATGLADDEKVQLQQYVTQCYGTLTTFNVLFAEKEDGFIGQKND